MIRKYRKTIGWSFIVILFTTFNLFAFHNYDGFNKGLATLGDVMLVIYGFMLVAALMYFIAWCLIPGDVFRSHMPLED